MNVFIYLDESYIDDLDESIPQLIAATAEDLKGDVEFVSSPDEALLGLRFEVGKKRALKEPLDALYAIAKKHKLDFVVGLYETSTGDHEEVCYFGNEEGKPDFYEVANYLGL